MRSVPRRAWIGGVLEIFRPRGEAGCILVHFHVSVVDVYGRCHTPIVEILCRDVDL